MGDDYVYDFELDETTMDALNRKANEENASETDILKAALANNQEQYRELSERLIAEMQENMANFDTRLKAIEAAITQSNKEKDINITSALQNASETIIGQMKGKFGELDTAINKSIKHLQDAQIDAKNTDIKLLAIVFSIIVLAFSIGGCIANYTWGNWYDIPAKVDAINNGIYQLLQKK